MIRISTCLIIMHVIAKSKVNCKRSFKFYFNTPHIDSAEIIYNIRMFVGAGHTCCGSGW